MKPTNPRAAATFFLLMASACLSTEAPPGDRGAPTGHVRVTAWDGSEDSLDAIARRPRIRLEAGARLRDPDGSVFVLRTDYGPDLIDDLQRAPLRSSNLERAVFTARSSDATGLWVTPQAALPPGAELLLAVGAWAETVDGSRPFPEGLALPLHVDDDPTAGAALHASFPPDGAAGVGTHVETITLAFDGALAPTPDAAAGVWIEAPTGRAVEATARVDSCKRLEPALDGHDCVRLVPTARLRPRALHRVVVGQALRDARGAPVGPAVIELRTAGGPDETAPALGLPPCQVDETALPVGCALIDDDGFDLRLRVDEPAVLALEGDELSRHAVALAGDARFSVRGLGPGRKLKLRLRARDASGNATQADFELSTHERLATLSITETRFDPLGPEPRQEFVEVLNYGSQPVDLRGFSLGDRPDAPSPEIGRPATVAPGARALLVADDFDPLDPADTPPPPGALLVRVGRSLGESGLRNSGEAIFLRDPLGRRVTAAPALPRPGPGSCRVRVAADPRSGASGSFERAPDGRCTPGR
ncbi:MAG: lamin tail domain-containing protein [Myxococcales bacterium]|jgi:hypothetical protein